ncbi:cytochrome P450 26C1-like [Pristis pectinata]|uniref:cytochrome P450 26C1-like n=1 Tax=Pristis pectinata TaxID=685728 RepID=UPI00223C993C|nr:cytochrome P450 26C1-like [Pristis pectinata]XP_051883302.1 cytochrome P450 26C1-like [Pristis pectinata]XP_051883303.1 cytochrome P450 26C1-like [Pristis pectinata]
MFLPGIDYLSALATALASLLSVLLLLAVSRQLWTLAWNVTRDRDNKLPLPKGSMGWPLLGETLHWMIQGANFHASRREKYGNVFKTHLLGRPVIRVTGAENIRKVLMGEHSLVSAQWPHSTRILLGTNTLANSSGELHRQRRRILARVFSHAALDSYIPGTQQVVRSRVQGWCEERAPVAVYPATKALTFCIAIRILLGLRAADHQLDYLSCIFEQLMENIFSLPLDIPFSGLRKGIKARNALHEYLEKAITEKLQQNSPGAYPDALDFMLNSARENGKEPSLQELKESAVELIFAAFSTTASASTSLVLLLLQHSHVLQKARQELQQHGLIPTCQCNWLFATRDRTGGQINNQAFPETENQVSESMQRCQRLVARESLAGGSSCGQSVTIMDKECLQIGAHQDRPVQDKEHFQPSPYRNSVCREVECPEGTAAGSETRRLCGDCDCRRSLSLQVLGRLRYLDCVVKEVLRLLPPVSGGYRTALQTFELNGCQIPKGWNIIYSIRDTQETASVYLNPDRFDPDRFGPERDESKAGRFNYLPFGGGVRSCIGKELAQVILKTLAIELISSADWELASAAYPNMQTVPVVHPVDGLKVRFRRLNDKGNCKSTKE